MDARSVLSALWVPAVCLAQAAAQPKLVLDTPHHDFGQIEAGTQVSHRFKILNAGAAPLQIFDLNTSCGCTSTVVGKKILAPGESTELEVLYDSTGASGPVVKTVQMITNDPEQPSREWVLQGEVRRGVTAAPDQILFQDVDRKVQQKASVKLVNPEGRPFRLTGVEGSGVPWLAVTPRAQGGAQWLDFVLLARELPQDQMSGQEWVRLTVATPTPDIIRIRVTWEARSPVSVSPARVAWVRPAGQELSAPVRLSHLEHKPFRILSARTDNPLLQVTGISPKAAARQEVRLVLSATAWAGAHHAKAYLTLDTPGHPELEIRVVAALR